MSTEYKVVPKRQGIHVAVIAGHIQHAVREPYLLDAITKDKIRSYVNKINEILDGRYLGLNAGGWVFCFRAYPYLGLKSWTDWKNHIINNNQVIIDEYGNVIDLDEFEKTILVPSLSGKHVEDDFNRDVWQDSHGYDFEDYDLTP